MARKNSRTCTFGPKLQKYYNFFKFQFEIALNGYLDEFLTWISLHLPKEASNALRNWLQLQSERTFETPCMYNLSIWGNRLYGQLQQLYIPFDLKENYNLLSSRVKLILEVYAFFTFMQEYLMIFKSVFAILVFLLKIMNIPQNTYGSSFLAFTFNVMYDLRPGIRTNRT